MIRPFKEDHIIRPRDTIEFTAPDGPLNLEIGCGVGFHPIKYAKENPDQFLIAIEKTRVKFEKFRRRLDNHSFIKNIHAVHADAVAWITHFLRPNCISRCFLLYPNPNPKNPAQRWFQMPFMAKLLEIIKPGGEIILRTNEKFYFDEALELAVTQWGLQIIENRIVPNLETPLTHFEKKYQLRREVCFEAIFKKPPASF